MKDNLVNPSVSPSNFTIDGEIEFSVNPSNHLLPSPCFTFKRRDYSPPNLLFHSLWIIHPPKRTQPWCLCIFNAYKRIKKLLFENMWSLVSWDFTWESYKFSEESNPNYVCMTWIKFQYIDHPCPIPWLSQPNFILNEKMINFNIHIIYCIYSYS